MRRSRQIILLAHCMLNQNAKVAGIAAMPGALHLIKDIIESGQGILQLPCPEQIHAGCRRWGATREQYDTPTFRAHCRNLLQPVMDQLEDYQANGYQITAVVGMDGSPSCGVNHTCVGFQGGEIGLQEKTPICHMASKPGVFMEIFMQMLRELTCPPPVVALDESRPEAMTWQTLQQKINNNAP